MTTFARRSLAALFAITLLAAFGAPQRASADTVTVTVDQAAIVKVPERVATIVIGNPLIADVSVQAGGMAVVTGKGSGVTNFIALDRNGETLAEHSIVVGGTDSKVVVVYKGVERESYSCAPQCNRRVMLGDSPPFFNTTLSQIGTRNALAQGAAR